MKPTLFEIALLSLAGTASFGQQANNAPYLDPNLLPERRAADLVSRMTLEVSFTLSADELPKSKVEISVGGGQRPWETYGTCRAKQAAAVVKPFVSPGEAKTEILDKSDAIEPYSKEASFS